jgi:hypothetical protein
MTKLGQLSDNTLDGYCMECDNRGIVRKEYIFVLNDIEKQMAEELIQNLASGKFVAQKFTSKTNDLHFGLGYEYRSDKQEKTVRGVMLNCPYKLRYRNRDRIFFSAWDCMDVCSVFYDMILLLYAMNGGNISVTERRAPFVPDMQTERYVFCTGQYAVSFAEMTDCLRSEKPAGRLGHHSSQYTFSLFEESDVSEYSPLFESLKANGYSSIGIFQIWIRGEILYYVIADGVVLRPEHQRPFTPKEEADLIRKIYKAVNNRFKSMNLSDESIYS